MMNLRQVILSTSIASALVVSLAITARAQSSVNWDPTATGGTGGTGSGNWDTTSNLWWNGSTDTNWNNANNDTAVFGNATSATTVTLTTGITAGGLVFNSNNYTITGNTLTLGGATPAITVTNAGTSATIASTITGSAGLTVAGAGTLILSGTNTYTGGTTVSSGTLKVNSTASLQGATSVASGATLQLNVSGAATWSNAITGAGLVQIELNGGTAAGSVATMVSGLSGFTGTIELANNGAMSFNRLQSNGISGASGATLLIDSGSQYYASSGNATYSAIEMSGFGSVATGGGLRGAIRLATGTLTATNGTTLLGNTTIGTEGGTLAGTISGTATTGNTQTLTMGTSLSTGAGTFTGVIGDGANGGTLALAVPFGTTNLVAANTYSGGTTVNGGTLNLSFSTAGAPATNIIKSGSALTLAGGTLQLTGKASTTNSQTFGTTTLNPGAETVSLSAGTSNPLSVNLGTVTRNAGATINFVQPTGTVSATNGTSLSAGGTASTILTAPNGAAYATVGGTDWAAMDGTNTFVVGLSTIAGGYTTFGATGTVTLTGNANLTAATAGTYTLGANSSPTTVRNTTVTGNTLALGTFNLVTGGVLSSQTLTISGTGKLEAATAGGELVLNQSANTTTISSQIANNTSASSVIKTGAGTVIFSNTTSGGEAYTGTTYVNQGTLQLGNDTGSGSVSVATSSFVVGPGATLDAGTVGTLSKNVTGAGNLQIGGGSFITNNSFSGNNSTYTGTTTITAGTATLTATAVINGTSSISVVSSNGAQVANNGSVTTATLGGVTINGGNGTTAGIWANNSGGSLTTLSLTLGAANGQTSGTAHGGAYTNNAGSTTTIASSITVNGEGSATAAITSSAAGSLFKVVGGTVSTGVLNLVSSASTNTISNQGGSFTQSGGTTTISSTLSLTANGGSGAVGAAGNDASFTLTGGTVNVGTISVNAGTLAVTGGTLNVGSGGITTSGTVAINLGAGTVGAFGSNWSSSAAMALTSSATGVTFNTTDSANGTTARTITHSGVLSGSGGLNAAGAGTLVLSGSDTYTGNTAVNSGALEFDFTAAGAPANNIVNSSTNGSGLVLGGGTLLLNGSAAGANSQQFNGLTLKAGSSAILLATNATPQNLALSLGTVTRNIGGVVDMTLPSGTASAANGISTSSGSAGTILTSNGVAYATINNGSDWAAMDPTNSFVVGLSTIAGGYTASTSTTLAGNADVASGVTSTTLPSGSTSITSLRFNQAQSTTITVGSGNTLVTGGILVTNAVGSNLSTISGGTLEGAAGQDLVIEQYNSANSLTISSVIADNTSATGLTKVGPGALTLTGVNTYTGPTELAGGLTNLNNSSAIGTGTLIFAGGNIDNTSGAAMTLSSNVLQSWNSSFTFVGSNALNLGTGAVTLGGNNTVTVGGSTLTVGGVISGTFNLGKAGAGTLTLTGVNTYTGNTTVNAGTLLIGGAGSLGAGTYAGAISLGSGATFQDGSTANQTLTGIISGSGALTESGTGTLFITTSTNTYAGGTNINSGTIALGNNGNENVAGLGTGAVTIGSGALLWLQPGSSSSAFNIANAITLNGGTVRGEDGNQHLQGAITVGAAGGTLQASWNGKDLFVDGVVSGSGNLTLSHGTTAGGAVSIHFTNAGNTYSGTVSVSGAGGGVTLDLDNATALQFATVNLNPGTAGAMVLTTPGATTIAGLVSSSGGSVKPATTAGTYTLTIGGSGTYSSAAVLANNTGVLGLTMNGTGQETLTGTSTYTGATTVNAGTLVVSGSISGSTTTVNSGGTLAGTGTTGVVLVNNGGTVTAGASSGSIGTLHTGALTLSGTYLLSLNSTLNTSDDLNVAGNLTLSGATLNLNDLSPGSGGVNLTIAQFTGTESGTFTGLAQGALVDNGLYSIDYGQQFANAITLVAIPEPSEAISLIGGVGLLLAWGRRRRVARR